MSSSRKTEENIIIRTDETVQVVGRNTGIQGPPGPATAQTYTTISLGPWTDARTLGFVASTATTISNETTNGTGTVGTRTKNGTSVSLPVSLVAGDLYEVSASGISGRFYISYKAQGA